MSMAAMKWIADTLADLNIPYQYEEWNTNPVPNPYFVGEFTEPESSEKEENGYQESTVMITGTGTSWIALETAKEKIEKNISKNVILPNGNGIAVFYSGSMRIRTGDPELKRIQINITIKEWGIT